MPEEMKDIDKLFDESEDQYFRATYKDGKLLTIGIDVNDTIAFNTWSALTQAQPVFDEVRHVLATPELVKSWEEEDEAIDWVGLFERGENGWRYDRPTVESEYLCILIFPEFKDGEKTGKTQAAIGVRWFGDDQDWAMDDEPEEGLVWTSQTGSFGEEKVFAWRELPAIDKLPEGVEWL